MPKENLCPGELYQVIASALSFGKVHLANYNKEIHSVEKRDSEERRKHVIEFLKNGSRLSTASSVVNKTRWMQGKKEKIKKENRKEYNHNEMRKKNKSK